METQETPEQPEVLQMLRYSRRFGVSVFNSCYMDWPYIASLELNICIDAEQDHESLIRTNLVLRSKQAGQP